MSNDKLVWSRHTVSALLNSETEGKDLPGPEGFHTESGAAFGLSECNILIFNVKKLVPSA